VSVVAVLVGPGSSDAGIKAWDGIGTWPNIANYA
jgi:hypothetical protein